jgi:hypothetical protein
MTVKEDIVATGPAIANFEPKLDIKAEKKKKKKRPKTELVRRMQEATKYLRKSNANRNNGATR